MDSNDSSLSGSPLGRPPQFEAMRLPLHAGRRLGSSPDQPTVPQQSSPTTYSPPRRRNTALPENGIPVEFSSLIPPPAGPPPQAGADGSATSSLGTAQGLTEPLSSNASISSVTVEMTGGTSGDPSSTTAAIPAAGMSNSVEAPINFSFSGSNHTLGSALPTTTSILSPPLGFTNSTLSPPPALGPVGTTAAPLPITTGGDETDIAGEVPAGVTGLGIGIFTGPPARGGEPQVLILSPRTSSMSFNSELSSMASSTDDASIASMTSTDHGTAPSSLPLILKSRSRKRLRRGPNGKVVQRPPASASYPTSPTVRESRGDPGSTPLGGQPRGTPADVSLQRRQTPQHRPTATPEREDANSGVPRSPLVGFNQPVAEPPRAPLDDVPPFRLPSVHSAPMTNNGAPLPTQELRVLRCPHTPGELSISSMGSLLDDSIEYNPNTSPEIDSALSNVGYPPYMPPPPAHQPPTAGGGNSIGSNSFGRLSFGAGSRSMDRPPAALIPPGGAPAGLTSVLAPPMATAGFLGRFSSSRSPSASIERARSEGSPPTAGGRPRSPATEILAETNILTLPSSLRRVGSSPASRGVFAARQARRSLVSPPPAPPQPPTAGGGSTEAPDSEESENAAEPIPGVVPIPALVIPRPRIPMPELDERTDDTELDVGTPATDVPKEERDEKERTPQSEEADS